MRWIAPLLLTLILPLGSCTVLEWIAGDSDFAASSDWVPVYDYSAYFAVSDNPWVGRSRDELVSALGPPDAIYEARPRYGEYDAGIPASTYVYSSGNGTSMLCIDAYVVAEPTSTVIKYYCR